MSVKQIIVYTAFTSAESTFLTGFADLAWAQGDTFYINGSGQAARLPIGTAGQVLAVNAGATAPQWSASAAGYTNLTQFVAQTAWRIFYSNGSGVVTELALGTSSQVLSSTGTTSAPNWVTVSGTGTVTNTGGNLTANAVVLGAGGADSKVVAGIITDGTSMISLGVNTTTLGKLKMFGNTSGDATIQPAAVAGTATVLTLPIVTGTLATLAGTETFTNKTLTSPVLTTPVINGASTGTGVASAATASTLALRDANGNLLAVNHLQGYTTTATAAGTTTLTVASTYIQYFTGVTTQTVVMPVASTLALGHEFWISNLSTGLVTIQSSGANTIVILAAGCSLVITCILASGTGVASWDVSSSYLATFVATGKKFTVSNSLTLAGTDTTTMTFPTTSATIARTDAGNTFTGASTASAWVLTSPTITTKISPTSDDGAPLGDTTHNFSDLFLASGAVINIANSNWVATHTSAILTVGTGDLRVTTAGTNTASVVTVGGTQTLTAKTLTSPAINTGTIGTSLVPTSNDGAPLGDTTHQFSDLFLAEGGVIDWDNGDMTITQVGDVMTIAGGNVFNNNFVSGYTTTVTAAANTTLTVASTQSQFFTGSTTQTLTLPVASTLTVGHSYYVNNASTGLVTVNTSAGNGIYFLASGASATFTCILASGTTAASWDATSWSARASSGKIFTSQNTITVAGTDGTTMTFPTTSATIARTDAANTFTGVQTITNITLPDQGQIKLTVPTTDLKATGPTCGDFNCGYSSSAIGDLVYLDSSSTWQKCDANTLLLYNGMLAIALEVKAAAAALLVALPGSFVYSTTGFPTWTIGGPIYMSETAGAMTHTAPTTTDAATRVVGWGVHADKMYFYPSPDYITHT